MLGLRLFYHYSINALQCWLFTTRILYKSWRSQKKTALQRAFLLSYSLCSLSFSVLCWACWCILVYNTSGTVLKTKVISMLLRVNQHFIAIHTIMQSAVNAQNFRYYFLSLSMTENFLNYVEHAECSYL